MANFLPLKTWARPSQTRRGKQGLTCCFTGVFSLSALAFLGFVHHRWGLEIVRNHLGLITFLGALTLFGTGTLLFRAPKKVLLGVAICLRLCWFVNEPVFSDDFARYLHEGQATLVHVAAPYNNAPETYTTQPHMRWANQVSHPHVTSSYFPLLQSIFAGAAWLHRRGDDDLQILRFIFILFELGVLLLLWRVGCFLPNNNPSTFSMYAFHPLPLLEVYGNSHGDIIGVFFLLLGFFAARNSTVWRAFCLAASAHIKPFVLVFGIYFNGKKRGLFLFYSLAFFTLMLLPHLFSGARIFDGFFTYARDWHAFGLAFEFFRAVIALLVQNPPGWLPRLCCGILWLAVTLAIWHYKQSHWPSTKMIFWCMFAFWFCAPTVHPWYLLWLLPWACLERNIFGWFWALFWVWHYDLLPDFHAGLGWSESLWPRLVLVSCGMAVFFWQQNLKQTKESAAPTSSPGD